MRSNTLNILYRVCDSVENYNSTRTTGSKKEIILNSFSSLVESICFLQENRPDSIVNLHIVYDNTSDETQNKFLEIAKEKNIGFTKHYTLKDQSGNMASFKLCYEVAKGFEGYIFFLEDDYVLDKKCCYEMVSFLNMWTNESHICVKPQEDLYMFTRDQIVENKYRQREVLLGNQCYWMRDISSTCTFCIDDFILKKSEENFENTFKLPRLYEIHLNKTYKEFPLFSPILSLGIHLQNEETLPPFYNGKPFSDFEYDSKFLD